MTDTEFAAVGWQYGVELRVSGTGRLALDLIGQQAFSEASAVDGFGRKILTSSLMLGAQKREYAFQNVSGTTRCFYQDVSEQYVKLSLDTSSFKNFTFSEDVELNGENVRIFTMAPPVPGSSENRVAQLQSTPSHSVTETETVTRSGSLILKRGSLEPLRFKSSSVLPRESWDRSSGSQGQIMTVTFKSFEAGRPSADVFKLPASWGLCKKMPHSVAMFSPMEFPSEHGASFVDLHSVAEMLV